MIVAVSTVKDTVGNVEKFVRRNLAGGVDHLIVFLDGDQPDVEASLRGSPFVTCVTTHHDWWHGRRQTELNDRQRTHATLAVRMLSDFAWVDWMFHVDGDEVVLIDRDALSGLAGGVRAVRLAPLEAVADVRATDDPTLFKPLLDDERLRRLAAAGVIRRPDNRAFFRGHVVGKVGVRPARDVRVAIHSAADAHEVAIPAVEDPAFRVLHYESPDPAQFLRKWSALLASGASVDQESGRRKLARKVRRLLEDDGEVADREARLERLFARHVADDVDALRGLGVLEEHDPDTWSHTPEPLPQADRPRGEEAVDRMRGVPKSSVLPPARRDAPVEPAPPRNR